MIKFTNAEYDYLERAFGLPKEKLDSYTDAEYGKLQDECFDAELEAFAESDGDTLAGDGAIAADIATRIGNEVFPDEEDEEDDE